MISPLIMFAQKLKQLRTEKVLTQDELAKQVHVSRSAVAKWEQGRGYPTEESIADLCALFGVSKDELIDDDKEALEQRRGEARKRKILSIINGALTLACFFVSFPSLPIFGFIHNFADSEGNLIEIPQSSLSSFYRMASMPLL
jgi:transcriptional regulator with XRE-family HTH domain